MVTDMVASYFGRGFECGRLLRSTPALVSPGRALFGSAARCVHRVLVGWFLQGRQMDLHRGNGSKQTGFGSNQLYE